MAWKDLEHFLVDLSKNTNLRNQFQANPDAVMTGYGLSPEEKKLVQSGNVEAIRSYLGDGYKAAASIQLD